MYNITCSWRSVAQFGRALRSGRRGRGFESRHFDYLAGAPKFLRNQGFRCFFMLIYWILKMNGFRNFTNFTNNIFPLRKMTVFYQKTKHYCTNSPPHNSLEEAISLRRCSFGTQRFCRFLSNCFSWKKYFYKLFYIHLIR